MLKAIMSRFESTDYGSFSRLTCKTFSCFTVERPWLNNRKQVSCIPAGLYVVKWHRSPRFGWCYKVQHVPGRDAILFHAGNFPRHSQGCILPAGNLGYIQGEKAGLLSRPTVLKFNNFFNHEDFLLEIRDDYIANNSTQ